MAPKNDPACMAEQRCARCSRIPWKVQIWELLVRFRKSRDGRHFFYRFDDDSVDDLDFALDALRQEHSNPSTDEHKDEVGTPLGLGGLRLSQVKRLGDLVPNQDERTSPEPEIDPWVHNEGDKERIKIAIALGSEESAIVYFKHHPNFAALERAAAMGCYLCSSLRAVIKPATVKGPLVKMILGRDGVGHRAFGCTRSPGRTLQLRYSSVPGETADGMDWFLFPKPIRRETLDRDLECLASEVIRPWVDACDVGKNLHQQCQPVSSWNSYNLPTRLIDVGTCSTDVVRLVVTSKDIRESIKKPVKYLTLSYCWGCSNNPAKTTPQNFEKRRKNIDIQSLPRTIQDAIRLTRAMKIRYLWVDALCIIQNLEDFYLEAPKMDSYYSGGYFLISATCFRDSSEGLFPDRQIGNYPTKTCTVGYDSRRKQYWLLQNPSKTKFSGGLRYQAVMDRAWCLQERLLSPRILHITPEAVFWKCRSIPEVSEFYRTPELQPSESEIESKIACMADEWGLSLDNHLEAVKLGWMTIAQISNRKPFQNYRNILRTGFDGILNQPSSTDMWLVWIKLIQQYVYMKLSYEDDRLTAIQGLGRELAKLHGDRYFGGIFLSHLAHGLLWRGQKKPRGERATRCPTWSWGIAERVEFINLERSLVSNIEDDSVFPPSTGMIEMMGQEARRLRLSVPAVPMAHFTLKDPPALKTSVIWANRNVEFTLYFDEERLVPSDLRQVKVILLGYTEGCEYLAGLVVRNSLQSGQYVERTGYAEVKTMNSDMMSERCRLDNLFKPWIESVKLV